MSESIHLQAEVSSIFAGNNSPPKHFVKKLKFDEIDDFERKEVAVFFAGKNWRDIDTTRLSCKRSYFRALTPEGMYYYLPAFILAGLRFPDSEITESLVLFFTEEEIFQDIVCLVSLLNCDQRRFTVRVMSLLAENYFFYSEEEITRAKNIIIDLIGD